MTDNNKPTIEMNVSFDHELHKKNEPVYEKATLQTTNEEKFLCIDCKEPVGVFDHLKVGQNAGPWYCKNCGTGHLIKRTEQGVDVAESSDYIVNTLALLQLKKNPEIKIVVESSMFVPVNGDIHKAICEQQDKDKYRYNTHTCPANYLQVHISDNGDTDPHGVFEHVQTIIKPEAEDNGRVITMAGYQFPDDYLAWIDLFPTLQ